MAAPCPVLFRHGDVPCVHPSSCLSEGGCCCRCTSAGGGPCCARSPWSFATLPHWHSNRQTPGGSGAQGSSSRDAISRGGKAVTGPQVLEMLPPPRRLLVLLVRPWLGTRLRHLLLWLLPMVRISLKQAMVTRVMRSKDCTAPAQTLTGMPLLLLKLHDLQLLLHVQQVQALLRVWHTRSLFISPEDQPNHLPRHRDAYPSQLRTHPTETRTSGAHTHGYTLALETTRLLPHGSDRSLRLASCQRDCPTERRGWSAPCGWRPRRAWAGPRRRRRPRGAAAGGR